MSFAEDDAKRRMTSADGSGDASTFDPPKANHRFGNGADSEELDTRLKFLPVTRDSDVIRKTKMMTNAGATAAAGWFPVPGLVVQVIQTP